MNDRVELRGYRAGDEAAILAAYNQVFPTADGRVRQRGMPHWLWKFRDNPTGLIHITVAMHGNECVGAYPCLPVRVWMDGAAALASQPADLVVLPEWRRHGERPGLFVGLGKLHYDLWCGPGDDQVRFHFGWPVPAWRLGQRYLRYENIRDWDFLFRETGASGIPRRPSSADLDVRAVPRFGPDVDALWDRLKTSMTLAIVRDARYLNWRYADAHDHTYELYECRDRSGALRGICVLTVCDFLFPNTALVVDWLCPLDDAATTVAMVAAMEQRASAARAGALATLFPQLDPRFLAFQKLGFLVLGTSYFTVVAPHDRHDTIYYREHWYHTCGDSDLV
jgi:hypothetical protein